MESISDYLKDKPCQGFAIKPHYNRADDSMTVFIINDSSYAENVTSDVIVYRSMNTKQITGVKICGVNHWIEESRIQFTVRDRDSMLGTICEMSDRAVDPQVKERLLHMIGKPNAEIKDDLIQLVDDAAHHSWMNGWMIHNLFEIWMNCGGTQREFSERNNRQVAKIG